MKHFAFTLFFPLCLLTLLLFSVPSYGKQTQNIGLSEEHSDYWADLSPEALKTFTKDIKLDLINDDRAIAHSLLTNNFTQEINDDTFLATRINKLLELGYVTDALKLFQKADIIGKPNTSAMRAGILAALFDEQPDLACLTYFSAKERKRLSTWKTLDSFCDTHVLKENAKTGEYNPLIPPPLPDITYIKPDNFQEKSLEARAFLMARNDVVVPDLELDTSGTYEPLTLLFIHKKTIRDKNTKSIASAYMDYYGIPRKEADSDNDDEKEDILYPYQNTALFNSLINLTKKAREKEILKQAPTAITKDIPQTPYTFYTYLLKENARENINETTIDALDNDALMDIAYIYAIQGATPPFPMQANQKPHVTLPFYYFTEKEHTDIAQLNEWVKSYCFGDDALPKTLCANITNNFKHLAEKEAEKSEAGWSLFGKKDNDYEKFFILTETRDYVMHNDGTEKSCLEKPNDKNKRRNLLCALTIGESLAGASDFRNYVAVMSVYAKLLEAKAKKRLGVRALRLWKEQMLVQGDTNNG